MKMRLLNAVVVALATGVGIAALAGGADAPPASPVARPIRQIDKLDDALTVCFQAADVAALMERTKPRFVFHDRDLIWITHDDAGKVGFAMNRVYHLKIVADDPGYYLLEASKDYGWPDPQNESFRYTRAVDSDPIIVARDPRRGVVYQARWPSAPETGSGGWTETRNIFLLCDGQHHWHLLGEGPAVWRAKDGADEYWEESVEAKVIWADAPRLADLSYTLVKTDRWGRIDGANDTEYSSSLTVRWELVPSKPDVTGLIDDIDPADVSPFQPIHPYLIESQAEPLRDLATRLAHCTSYAAKTDRDRQKLVDTIVAALHHDNPNLPDNLKPGQKLDIASEANHLFEP